MADISVILRVAGTLAISLGTSQAAHWSALTRLWFNLLEKKFCRGAAAAASYRLSRQSVVLSPQPKPSGLVSASHAARLATRASP
jgi:hypothetical protein